MAERRNNRILIGVWFILATIAATSLVACQKSTEVSETLRPKVNDSAPPIQTPTATIRAVEPSNTRARITETPELAKVYGFVETPETNPAQVKINDTKTTNPTAIPFATLESALPTPATAVPLPAITQEIPDHTTNIVLLGNDVPWAQGGRTDTIVLVSINSELGVVSLLSIPRDLFVVIPGWTMNRINLALPHGHGQNYPGGGGALIKDTILYNLGIPVDFYVRIGFDGFEYLVDQIGGIEIPVNCPIEDWRLIADDLDPEVEQNWELFSLNSGVHHMDGQEALWYARTRRTSNDFDRARRQQQVISAVLRATKGEDWLQIVPLFWENMANYYETDLALADVLNLLELIPNLDQLQLRHYLLAGEALRPWKIPNSGEAVQLLNYEEAQKITTSFLQPSVLHQAERAKTRVVIETNNLIMFEQVADNLRWYGFEPVLDYRESRDPLQTRIAFSGSNLKGTFAGLLSWIFRQGEEEILLLEENTNTSPEFIVTLSRDHNPCLPYLSRLNGEPGSGISPKEKYSDLAKKPEAN